MQKMLVRPEVLEVMSSYNRPNRANSVLTSANTNEAKSQLALRSAAFARNKKLRAAALKK
jgi:hypothetical protein